MILNVADVELHLQAGGYNIRLLLVSVYLPYESTEDSLSLELRGIVEFGAKRKRRLILVCNANTF